MSEVRELPVAENAPRTCGACTACCTALGVADLQPPKPAHQRCAHERRKCTIYETRPASCRAYRCGWLQGAGALRDRPDRSGVIVDQVATGPLPFLLEQLDAPWIAARELHQGAFEAKPGERLLDWLRERGLVALVYFGGQPPDKPGLIGPDRYLSRVQRVLERGAEQAAAVATPIATPANDADVRAAIERRG